MSKWNNHQMMTFIHLYESHPCLWKSDLSDYKNRDKRQSALENIVAEMNIPNFTLVECKNKIKNLRSHYCQELKKIKNSMKSGAGSEEVYKPSLPWFAALDSFLQPLVTQKTVSNLEQQSTSHESTVYAQPTFTGHSSSRNTKRKRDGDETGEKFLSSALHRLETISANAIATSKKTEFDIFGQSVAAQLNNMTLEDALQLQLEIQQLITRKRINHRMQLLNRQLQRNNNNSPS
ncbi:uncharacterized protein LOC117601680 [Osmia lignaria lignaria]|uniref:uncharacterized protein LOC117601680 n=1 Tax=Osmia lignaria lignaria TaxID=1437193 RepID=UPI00402BA36E